MTGPGIVNWTLPVEIGRCFFFYRREAGVFR